MPSLCRAVPYGGERDPCLGLGFRASAEFKFDQTAGAKANAGSAIWSNDGLGLCPFRAVNDRWTRCKRRRWMY
ncbi:hypothetical protein HJFPF1_08095 [Paramyrothecium foliicola]|nr:hypothetical protein HJFPF1_08095 [Paramyrothecium foliicola]